MNWTMQNLDWLLLIYVGLCLMVLVMIAVAARRLPSLRMSLDQSDTEEEGLTYDCPVCGSDQIEGGAWESLGDGGVAQDVWCLDCSASWTEIYTLTEIVIDEKKADPTKLV